MAATQQRVNVYRIIGDTFTLAPRMSGSFRQNRVQVRSGAYPLGHQDRGRVQRKHFARVGHKETPGSSTGSMHTSSPSSTVNGHGPSVHVAALTVLDCSLRRSSAGRSAKSGAMPPTSEYEIPSPNPTDTASTSRRKDHDPENSGESEKGNPAHPRRTPLPDYRPPTSRSSS